MTFTKLALITAASVALASPAFAQTPAANVEIPATHGTAPMKTSGTMMKSDTALTRSAPGVSDTKKTATGGESGGSAARPGQ